MEAASELDAIDAAGVYECRLRLRAPRERAYDAVATLTGVRSWWTPIVEGRATAGGRLCFGFAGLDESIVMHVDLAEPASAVHWSCLTHSRCDQWNGTRVKFAFVEQGPATCELWFRHEGLAAELVERGWERFLASLASYVEDGRGAPYERREERTERANDDD